MKFKNITENIILNENKINQNTKWKSTNSDTKGIIGLCVQLSFCGLVPDQFNKQYM